jgi:hypothetical protein
LFRGAVAAALELAGYTGPVLRATSALEVLRRFIDTQVAPALVISPWIIRDGAGGYEAVDHFREHGYQGPIWIMVVETDELRKGLIADKNDPNLRLLAWKEIEGGNLRNLLPNELLTTTV